jgi:chemotaxis methyl-accepting protein methylase
MPDEATDDAAFRALLEQVARDRGFPCANYKDGCLRRRIAVRMRARGAADFAAYAHLLALDPHEYERLIEVLTINVTRLFRDADAWELLAERVLPGLWEHVPRFTAWSAGCASGEELYTVAALLHRHALRTATTHRLERATVIGTDIDEASLRAAARGAYGADQFTEVPVEVRTRYFGPTAPHVASADLRALVRVERRNLLLESPPATDLQLITCRNVLIYLDRASQEPLIRRFHEALAPGGVLMLGKVETLLGPTRELFSVIDQRQRIFQRRSAA